MGNKKGVKPDTKDNTEDSKDTLSIENGVGKECDSGHESSGSSSGSASPSSPEKDIAMNFTESADSLLNGDISSARQQVAVGGEE